MADADRRTIAAGVPGIRLMERAGAAVADAVRVRFRPDSRIVVVAGPGNNGGDGFVAARLLSERGYGVEVALVGEIARLKGDAALAAKAWPGSVMKAEPGVLEGAHLIIDAVRRRPRPSGRGSTAGNDRSHQRTIAPLSRWTCRAASTAILARSWDRRSKPGRPLHSFARNRAICFSPEGFIAVRLPSPILEFPHTCWRISVLGLLKTSRRCGP